MNYYNPDSNNQQYYKDHFSQAEYKDIFSSIQAIKENADKIDMILTGSYETNTSDANQSRYPQQIFSELYPFWLDCCMLFKEFDTCSGVFKKASPRDKQRLLASIATSLCKTAGGADYFIDQTERFKDHYRTTHKSKSWPEQIIPFLAADYNPCSCVNCPCPYADHCNHEKNMLLTAIRSRGLNDECRDDN